MADIEEQLKQEKSKTEETTANDTEQPAADDEPITLEEHMRSVLELDFEQHEKEMQEQLQTELIEHEETVKAIEQVEILKERLKKEKEEQNKKLREELERKQRKEQEHENSIMEILNSLVFPTEDLDSLFYQISYSKALPLIDQHGEYNTIRKLLTYSMIGALGQKENIIIRYNAVETDPRISCIFDMPPGSGKNSIKNMIVDMCTKLNLSYDDPQMGFHEEQLLGSPGKEQEKKVKIKKSRKEGGEAIIPFNVPFEVRKSIRTYLASNKDTESTEREEPEIDGCKAIYETEKELCVSYKTILPPHVGYLGADYAVFDECPEILSEKEYSTARHYFKISQDMYGRNAISKWKVSDNTDRKFKLRFFSPTTLIFCLQPSRVRKLNSMLLEEGFVRRFFIGSVERTMKDLFGSIHQRLCNTNFEWSKVAKTKEEIFALLQRIRERWSEVKEKGGFDIDPYFEYIAGELSIRKLNMNVIKYEQTVEKFTIDCMNTLTEKLLVMSCIQSIADSPDGKVTKDHIIAAWRDLCEIWEQQIQFIVTYFNLSAFDDYDNQQEDLESLCSILKGWGIENPKTKKIDRIICSTSEETGMPLNKFVQHIARTKGCAENTARQIILRELKRRGFVETNTSGRGRLQQGKKAVIWIAQKPKKDENKKSESEKDSTKGCKDFFN